MQLILDKQRRAGKLKVKLVPIISAIRNVRYLLIKEIYVWDIDVKYEDVAALVIFLTAFNALPSKDIFDKCTLLAQPFQSIEFIYFVCLHFRHITLNSPSTQSTTLNCSIAILTVSL